jgi:hypothetical protein
MAAPSLSLMACTVTDLAVILSLVLHYCSLQNNREVAQAVMLLISLLWLPPVRISAGISVILYEALLCLS